MLPARGQDGDSGISPEHANGTRALITGAMAILGEISSFLYPTGVTAKYDPDQGG